MNGLVRKDPLTHRETLVILEHLFDIVLNVEQQRRDQPPPEDVEALDIWCVNFFVIVRSMYLSFNRTQEFQTLVDQLWDALRVMVPLETRYDGLY